MSTDHETVDAEGPEEEPEPLTDEEAYAACMECGGRCCSFRTLRISFVGLHEGQRYDSMLLEHEDLDQLLFEDGEVPDMDWFVKRDDEERSLVFECNHLEDGLCTEYDRRPSMCQMFECDVLTGHDDLDEWLERTALEDGELEGYELREVTDRVREILAREATIDE